MRYNSTSMPIIQSDSTINTTCWEAGEIYKKERMTILNYRLKIYIYMFRERVVNQCSAARGKVTKWRRENNEMKITRPGIIQKMPWEITLSFDQNSFCYVHRWPISWLRTDRKGEITWSLRSTTVQKTSSKKSNYSFITQNEVQWMCKPHSPEDVLQCGKNDENINLRTKLLVVYLKVKDCKWVGIEECRMFYSLEVAEGIRRE